MVKFVLLFFTLDLGLWTTVAHNECHYQPPPPPPPPPPPELPPPPNPDEEPGAVDEEEMADDREDPRLDAKLPVCMLSQWRP